MEERYATEEQQIEAIKKFWKENGMAIVAGAVIGIGGLVGWNTYSSSVLESQESASAEYAKVVEQLSSEQGTDAVGDYLTRAENPAYLALAGMQLAATHIENGELEQAASALQKVADSEADGSLKSLAMVRLARVQKELGQLEQALATITSVPEQQYAAARFEVEGDIQQALGDLTAAEQAYTKSAELSGANSLVQVKLDNLAVAGDTQ